MQKRQLFTILVIVFIDLLGFGLILPLLPFYAENYQASPMLVGLLVASYAAMQFIGTPLLGRLSDQYGRRPILLISIFGTFTGFMLLGLAEPIGLALAGLLPPGDDPVALQNWLILGVLFFSRMLDGLTGGNISVAQAYIADVTDEKNRAKGMGLIGAAFGLGFIIGPAVGGLLSRWGFAAPAFAAALLAFLNLLAVYAWLPESLTEEKKKNIPRKTGRLLSLQDLKTALRRPRVGPLLQIWFLYGLAFAMFKSIFTLYAQYHLSLTVETTGYLLAYMGLLVVFVQGGAIGWLTARFSETALLLTGVAMMSASLLAWGLVPNVALLMVVLMPLSLAGGVVNTITNSLISKSVYTEEVGGILGLSASLESLTRVIAPSLGGVLLGQIGTWAPGLFGSLLTAWLVYFVWQRLIANPDPPLPERPSEEPALGRAS